MIYEQPPWNPHASIEWRTLWHQQGWRDVLAQAAAGWTIHPYMIALCIQMGALSSEEVQAHLWPKRRR